MAKADLLEKLATLGVTDEASKIDGIEKLDGTETVKQLEEILEKAEATAAPAAPAPEAGVGPAAPAEPAAPAAPVNKRDAGDSVDIMVGKTFIRYYSKEVHGENFLDLAKELCGKPEYATRGYTIVPSSDNELFEVRYREKEDAEKPLDDQDPDAPTVDKSRRFEDREEALSFRSNKSGSIVAVAARKK